MRSSGLVSHASRRTAVVDGSGLSRGDGNRNGRLGRLRELLPAGNAIVGIDLAQVRQAAVVTDHDWQVVVRCGVSCRAWEARRAAGLGGLLDWALERARAAGFASVTVACEPTGHRWRVLDQLAAQRGLPLVCVQPLLVWRAREAAEPVVKHAGLCPRDNSSGQH